MKKPFVLHPFLFAIAPIVFLFAHNVEELEFSDIKPLFFVLIFSSVLFLFSFLAFRHKQKAGLFTSILLIIFFSYGHLSEILKYPKIDVGGLIIKSNTIIFSIYILVILVTLFLIKKYKNFDNLTKSLNVMASILILVSLANIAYYKITALDLKQARKGTEDLKTENVDFNKPATPSNIFYIIVDGYGRQDIIKEFYGYGNSEFIDYLKKSGFYVASKSKSNYHSTNLSLPSSLNFDYLNVLPKPDYRSALMNNNVFKLMKQQGYETIVISSGDFTNKIKKADVYLAYSKALTDFENEVLNLTPIPFFLRKLSRFAISKSIVDQYSMHREKVNYVFDALADISKSKKPIFVYAYICSPHPPFVFGPNGEKVESGSKFVINDTGNFNASHSRGRYVYTKGYANQLKYINKKLMSALDIILSTNKNPIIIIQGDHGPRSLANWEKPDETCWKECYSILNAYHLPNNGNDNLYNSITPVNTFRIISNHYFGTSYKLLEDKSYFYRKGELIDVTDKVDSDAACDITVQH
jgi:galactitol-specific phosphotransferase system IIB component